MEPFNFDKLPEVVRLLFEKVEHLEEMVSGLQPKDDNENQLLSVKEAAEFLKVSVPALYTKVSRKEIPVSKPGKRLYFNKNDLKEWVQSGKKKTLTELRKESDMRLNRQKRSTFH